MSANTHQNPGIEMAVRLRLACELHEPSIHEHLDRVSHYTCQIGRLLGFSDDRVLELHHAAPLHDVGKIGVPVALLDKPGPLTFAEMEIVKTHTVLGHQILAASDYPVMICAAQIALSHHESWDGTGYPHGLAGTDIPLDARIVAVADVYDALVSQRSYKPAWDEGLVVTTMRQMRGTRFDPAILDLFLDNLPASVAHRNLAPSPAH